jgi:hypothetical protein
MTTPTSSGEQAAARCLDTLRGERDDFLRRARKGLLEGRDFQRLHEIYRQAPELSERVDR